EGLGEPHWRRPGVRSRFCRAANPCDNAPMRKNMIAVRFFVLGVALFAGNAGAQQNQAPAAGTQHTPAQPSQKPPAAKDSAASATALTTDREKESYAL